MDVKSLADMEALLGRDQRDVLLRMAIHHAEQSLDVMAAQPVRVRAEAHRLRGAVAPFGATNLAELLRRVETGEEVAAGAVRNEVERFTAACRAALAG